MLLPIPVFSTRPSLRAFGEFKLNIRPVKNKTRVLFAGFVHESHTFLEGETSLSDFCVREGDEILMLETDSSPTGGFLTVAKAQQWEVVPTILAVAEPSAIISDEAFESIWGSFKKKAIPAITQGIDAIYFVLHGAGSCKTYSDAEGEWLKRVRQLDGVSGIPIFGVIDLHANFSQAMADHSDCLIAYRENPHTDSRESAMRAADLLASVLNGSPIPRHYVRQVPIMWPPTGTATACDPMRALLAEARSLEQSHPELTAININAGFSFGDGPEVGVSFSLSTVGGTDVVERVFQRLTAIASQNAAAGDVTDESIDSVFEKLDRWREDGDLNGLHVLVEPSDNIGGGGPGGGVTLLRRLHKEKFPNVGFAVWDVDAIETLRTCTVGDRVSLSLGGKGSRLYDGPVILECELVRFGSGRFELEDKHSHLASQTGDWFDMGDCAIIRCDELTILVSTKATPPMDLGQWKHFGINPEDFTIIVIKAAVAHRAAYDPIARRQLWVETRGPCTSDLTRFDYRARRRPMLPFEPLAATVTQ